MVKKVETVRKAHSIPVTMPDGSTFYINTLFRNSISQKKKNKKLLKSDKASDYLTMGLALAPSLMSGYQTCPNATPGCKSACIFTSGNAGIFPLINRSRIAKTRAWFEHREAFKKMLVREVNSRRRWCEKHNKKLAIRLNVFSDIAWEKLWPQLFKHFADVQFYDYTKSVKRALAFASGNFPANYHLVFSRSETNEADCVRVLQAGGNVAVVFGITPLAWKNGLRPAAWHGYRVIDGDKTDLRFMEPDGVVVGLYAKGNGRKDTTGFVVREQPEEADYNQAV